MTAVVFGDDRLPGRFWQKVHVNGDGCWLWLGSCSGSYGGYGCFRLDGKVRRAHRVAYVALVGDIPDGMELDHRCATKLCVNPLHLEPVTHRENVLRADSPPTVNARKQVCREGHPLEGANLVMARLRQGRRQCRICNNQRDRERKASP